MSIYKIKMELYINDSLDQLKNVASALYGNALMNNIIFMDQSFKSRLNLSEDIFFDSMSNRIPLKLYAYWYNIRIGLLINIKNQILVIELIPHEPYSTKLDEVRSIKSFDLGLYIETILALSENFLIRELYTEKLIELVL